MLARGSGGILNVASTIAFQPAPYQAVYGASKAFVLSFSQALWAEARAAGVAVTALCPGPTRTGFVDALGADVGHTAIYSRLAEPEPVIDAGLRALDKGRAVVIPGVRNRVVAASGRFMPREWLTLVSARLLRPVNAPPRATDRGSQRDRDPRLGRTGVGSADRRRTLAVLVSGLPMGPRRVTGRVPAQPARLPVEGTPGRTAQHGGDRPIDRTSFAILADAAGLHAERTFTLRPTPDGSSTVVVSDETQVGPLPWLGRAFLAPRLHAANQAMFDDLARAAAQARRRRVPPRRTPEAHVNTRR